MRNEVAESPLQPKRNGRIGVYDGQRRQVGPYGPLPSNRCMDVWHSRLCRRRSRMRVGSTVGGPHRGGPRRHAARPGAAAVRPGRARAAGAGSPGAPAVALPAARSTERSSGSSSKLVLRSIARLEHPQQMLCFMSGSAAAGSMDAVQLQTSEDSPRIQGHMGARHACCTPCPTDSNGQVKHWQCTPAVGRRAPPE